MSGYICVYMYVYICFYVSVCVGVKLCCVLLCTNVYVTAFFINICEVYDGSDWTPSLGVGECG